jgi:hypothetical protein
MPTFYCPPSLDYFEVNPGCQFILNMVSVDAPVSMQLLPDLLASVLALGIYRGSQAFH